jgi:hypothetical protein
VSVRAGDGFLASFDGPARAISCACAIVEGVRDLGLEVRAGLHTGECELVEGKVAGIAVHTGARVVGLAGASEVLVSSTVKISSRAQSSGSKIAVNPTSTASPSRGASSQSSASAVEPHNRLCDLGCRRIRWVLLRCPSVRECA